MTVSRRDALKLAAIGGAVGCGLSGNELSATTMSNGSDMAAPAGPGAANSLWGGRFGGGPSAIMQQINKFNGEWDKYVKAVDDVKSTFDKFSEKLEDISTGGTRFNKLAVPVRAIEKMRKKQGIPELGEDSAGELELGDE